GGGLAGAELPPSWAAEGRAMRRAIAADFAAVPGFRVVMTLDARFPDEPGPWCLVRISPDDESRQLARLAAEAGWTLVIAPESDGILADRTRWIERAGGRLLGSSAEAVELAGDKLRLSTYWQSQGIRTPACCRVIPRVGLPENLGYPVVLKPIDGAGAVDTFLIPGAQSIPDEVRALLEALVQPFVEGVPMSASFLVGPGSRATLLAVGRQRVVI